MGFGDGSEACTCSDAVVSNQGAGTPGGCHCFSLHTRQRRHSSLADCSSKPGSRAQTEKHLEEEKAKIVAEGQVLAPSLYFTKQGAFATHHATMVLSIGVWHYLQTPASFGCILQYEYVE